MYKPSVISKEGYKVENRGYSSPCWIWTGCITSNGYGMHFLPGSKSIRAHKYYYIRFKGPIPKGRELDHLCRVRCCINPDHLEVVTHSTNQKRSFEAMRKLIQRKEV